MTTIGVYCESVFCNSLSRKPKDRRDQDNVSLNESRKTTSTVSP